MTRTGGGFGAISVAVAASGTASVPGDATVNTTTVSFADGDVAPKTLQVTVVDDAIADSGETAIFSLTNPQGGAVVGTQNAYTLTITDTDAPAVTTTAGSLAYTENQAATPIDTLLTVADADSANLASASVQITGNYQNGQDILACPACAGLGITANFTATTGTLALTGTVARASYETALRSVTYQNTSENPSPLARTVTFQVADTPGNNLSNAPTRGITVAATNERYTRKLWTGGFKQAAYPSG